MIVRLVYYTVLALACVQWGCAMTPKSETSKREIPFTYAGSHLIKIPVTVNDTTPTYYILDTGIGVNLLSTKLAEKFGTKTTHGHTGKRMSGQEIKVSLGTIESLTVAGLRQTKVETGIWDMSGFLVDDPALKDVEGFLSLNFFKATPFTMDYKTMTLTLEDDESVAKRAATGRVLPVEVHQDGPALTLFFKLQFPDGHVGRVEIDLGGNILTLDEKHMTRMGTKKGAKNVVVEKNKDETNFSYVRYFSDVKGPVFPVGLEDLKHENFKVMYQDIIYDGLVGNQFMKRFTVTYDIPRSRVIFNR